MASAGRLYRVALVLAGAGVLAVAAALASAAARTTLAAPSLGGIADACRTALPSDMSPMALAVLALGVFGAAVVVRAVVSLWRRLRAQRRLLGALCGREIEIAGRRVTVIEDLASRAFCGGYLWPRVYVSSGAIARLDARELDAVVEHEEHHRRRRDPLRMLLLEVLADGLFFAPALRALSNRYAALAEVAADEAAVGRCGAGALASALVGFDGAREPDADVVGIAPERVDHLLGERLRWRLPPLVLLGSSLAVLGLFASAVAVLLAAGTSVDAAVLTAQGCMAMLCPLLALGAAAALARSCLRLGS